MQALGHKYIALHQPTISTIKSRTTQKPQKPTQNAQASKSTKTNTWKPQGGPNSKTMNLSTALTLLDEQKTIKLMLWFNKILNVSNLENLHTPRSAQNRHNINTILPSPKRKRIFEKRHLYSYSFLQKKFHKSLRIKYDLPQRGE